MGAVEHLALFDQAAKHVDALGADGLQRYLGGEYFGDNEDRDSLSGLDERFFDLNRRVRLMELNAAWLRGHEALVVLPMPDLEAKQEELIARIPDLDVRKAAAREAEPSYVKNIRRLCEVAGQELVAVTAGHVIRYRRRKFPFPRSEDAFAWFFVTDKGVHYMVEIQGRVYMHARGEGGAPQGPILATTDALPS